MDRERDRIVIAIRGGSVYSEEGFVDADVLIEGSEITEVGVVSESRRATDIDATGCLVGPGLVDIHVHFREPGQTWKEDIESGSKAAARGGFTAVVAMPNTDPPADDVKVVSEVVVRGAEVGLVEVASGAALTVGRNGTEPSALEGLYRRGVRVFTDDGDSVLDDEVLREVMQRLSVLPEAVLSQHAEDASMTIDGHMHQGAVSTRLAVGGLPSEAESSIVARDLALVAETGVAYHCQHVSAAATVELIRQAKDRGLPVTAEVTPHHLTFEESALESLDTDFKMYPPLRSMEDRTALREALNDGTIDVVATDHAPHITAEKNTSFQEAPRGVIGLETAAAAVAEVVSDPARLFEVMSVAPALLADFERQGRPIAAGEPANVVVFDPGAVWVPHRFESRSSNSPYRGRSMLGRVRATIFEGLVTHLQEDEDD